jgi:hypothetical protein
MSNLYRGPFTDASYQILIHLAKRLQRRRFTRNQPIRNKNCLWRPCLITDRDEMSNLYTGPAIDASYQFSVHLAKWFQRRISKCKSLRHTTDGRAPSDGKNNSSISVRTKQHLLRCYRKSRDRPWPEVTWPEITWPEEALTGTENHRKWHDRKWSHAHARLFPPHFFLTIVVVQ